MVVLGRCSWKHHSPQFTVGPFLRDGYTLYMHLYPILVDGYALVGLVRKCKRRCKYLARGLLSLISSRKFPKTELRTHPICFCAASSKTHNVFCVFCFTYLQQWCLNTWLGHKRPNMSDGLMSFASKAQKWRHTHTQKPSDGRQLSSHVPAHVSGQNHAHVICSTYGEKQLQLFPCHLTISDPNSFIVPNLIRIIYNRSSHP